VIRELLEQLLLAALIDHAAREVARDVPPAAAPERRHSYACNLFNGGMCSCY
jgi:hypothetical protein